MTDWLEFHDSVLTALTAPQASAELLLDAYIHRWEKSNDEWRGTGWMQAVRIVVIDAAGASALPELPAVVSDGRLSVGAASDQRLAPLPLQACGAVTIWLQLAQGDILEFTGNGVRVEAVAEARYLEDLFADLRPEEDP